MRVVEKGDWSVKLSVNLRHQLVSAGDVVDFPASLHPSEVDGTVEDRTSWGHRCKEQCPNTGQTTWGTSTW